MATDQPLVRHDKEGFSSRIGLILSCMGCMVGTGNIWRFPRIVAQNSQDEGSLVIVLIWLMFLLLWSIPMLLIEYAIGRYTGKAVIQSFREFLGDKFIWMGGWITFIPIVMACWYSVVLGWCFYYTVHCMTHTLPQNVSESTMIFNDFVMESHWPALTHGVAVFIASMSVIKGGKTIEKVNMVFVPVFLILIVATFFWAVSRESADQGLRFLFSPNWGSFLSPRAFVDALCQNAFDTGAGIGLMVAYSTYMTRRDGIVKYASIIPACNNLISLICVMTIFSIVFSVLKTSHPEMKESEILNVLQDSGLASTGLTFIWLPVLFASVGSIGRVLAVMYFLCLSFAGITSMIAYLEIAAQTLQNAGVPRYLGVPVCFLAIYLGGLPSALSITILVDQDFVWAFALVISGLMLQFLVIKYGVTKFRSIVINDYSENDWHLPRVWDWIIKFIAPIEAIIVLIWWAVDVIMKNVEAGVPWYAFGQTSFMTTIVQWATLLFIMGGINIVIYLCQSKYVRGDNFKMNLLDIEKEVTSGTGTYGTLPAENESTIEEKKPV